MGTLRRTMTLGKASLIYACSWPESAVLGQVDVDILVHFATNTYILYQSNPTNIDAPWSGLFIQHIWTVKLK